ncbi:GNAT family N-acetyltransferase [Kitasatospora sp. NPDC088391]|uniref:GNAT family N-acetyltransferase n=1 Tax=Kitasatospora sp. NPDC088391 TaxID=3364074 RepID=UPI00380E8ADD
MSSSFAPLTELSDWYPAFRQRHLDGFLAAGLPPAAALRSVDELLDTAQDLAAVAVLDADGRRVGQAAVLVVDPGGRAVGRVVDLWTDPALDPAGGHRRAALEWAREWCVGQSARRFAVRLAGPDACFDDFPVRSQTRFKAFGAGIAPVVEGVTIRPMTADEFPGWMAEEQEGYAADIVRSGSRSEREAREQSEKEFAELLPAGLATPDTSVLVIEADGVRVGVVWLRHGYLPEVGYLYSVAVDPAHRGRGFGRAAMAVSEAACTAAGDRGLLFNVFGGNDVAMNLYTSTGSLVLEEHRSIDLSPAAP